jgi:hypothetical protein
VLTRHYTYHNLSSAAQTSATTLFLTLATLCETALATLETALSIPSHRTS